MGGRTHYEVGTESGHTHEPYDYRLAAKWRRARCIGNPCGYVAESRGPNYRPGCVVEI